MVSNNSPTKDLVPRLGWMDLALIIVVSIWGINFVINRALVDVRHAQFLPVGYSALRMVMAALLSIGLVGFRALRVRIGWHDVIRLSLLGFIGLTVTQIFLINGIAHTTATNTALIQATIPILVALQNHIFRIERMGILAWIGVTISLVGLCFVILNEDNGYVLSWNTMTGGSLLVMASTVTWVTYIVMTRPLVQRLPASFVTTYALSVGALGLLIAAIPDFASQDWTVVTPGGWAGLVFSGCISMGLCNHVWTLGIQRLGGNRTALYSNLIPLMAVGGGFVFLGEHLSGLQTIGATAVLVGVVVARRACR